MHRSPIAGSIAGPNSNQPQPLTRVEIEEFAERLAVTHSIAGYGDVYEARQILAFYAEHMPASGQ